MSRFGIEVWKRESGRDGEKRLSFPRKSIGGNPPDRFGMNVPGCDNRKDGDEHHAYWLSHCLSNFNRRRRSVRRYVIRSQCRRLGLLISVQHDKTRTLMVPDQHFSESR